MLTTLFLSTALAVPPIPTEVTPTAAELVLLEKRGVPFRSNPADDSMAISDINAPPNTLIAAVMNLRPRIDEIGPLLTLEPYEVSGTERYGARWELGASIYSAAFHVVYDCDLSAGWCVYGLDPAKDNDLKRSDGSYQVYAYGSGSRLVYRSNTQGSIVPDFLMKKFAQDGAVDLLTGIRARAEG